MVGGVASDLYLIGHCGCGNRPRCGGLPLLELFDFWRFHVKQQDMFGCPKVRAYCYLSFGYPDSPYPVVHVPYLSRVWQEYFDRWRMSSGGPPRLWVTCTTREDYERYYAEPEMRTPGALS